jgi:hypothetical protein
VSDEEPEETAPRPARPKRKKRPTPEPEHRSEPDPEQPGDAVPAFALKFPDDPALQALVAAFEQGDYARVRREAPALIKQTDRAEVRKAARELVKRLDPDPIAVYLLAGAALLLAFLACWYWTHPHVAP